MRKKVNREDLINGWLKYHNTSVKEIKFCKQKMLNIVYY